MHEWQGETLKAITFPLVVKEDAATIWHRITGEFPDNAVKKGLQPPLLSIAAGDWRGFTLNIVLQPGRVEANITMVDPNPQGPEPVPPIPVSRLSEAYAVIQDVAQAIVEDQPYTRLGAASQLVIPVKNAAEGIAILNDELHDVFRRSDDSVLYQTNLRKVLLALPGRSMNRLCKWGVVTVGSIGLAVRGDQIAAMPKETSITLAYWHLDMNTVPLEEPIGQAQVRTLFKELWVEEERVRAGGIDVL
jgi:hypothetical protein